MASGEEKIPQTEDQDSEKGTRRAMAPELHAMNRMDALLEGLDDDAQTRVLQWVNAKYGWEVPAYTMTSFGPFLVPPDMPTPNGLTSGPQTPRADQSKPGA